MSIHPYTRLFILPSAPTVDEDETEGYEVGDVVISGGVIYDCTDNTTVAAVWQERPIGVGAETDPVFLASEAANFETGDKAKLDGIEAGAEVNVPETDTAALAALGNHLADTADAHAASAITNTPTGSIAATDVQTAINELATEKSSTAHSHDHSTLAGVGSIQHSDLEIILLSGWFPMVDTWTRTGNHTFTISGDLTLRFPKGTKIRYKDGGSYEYGVVASSTYSSPNTTVNLIPNTNYAMAAATITDRYISNVETPEGFPTSFSYALTVSASSGSITTYTVNQAKATPLSPGKLLLELQFDISNNGTGSGALLASTPTTLTSISTGYGRENATSGAMLQGYTSGSTLVLFNYANGYPVASGSSVYFSAIVSY